jgi:hypothetical protein
MDLMGTEGSFRRWLRDIVSTLEPGGIVWNSFTIALDLVHFHDSKLHMETDRDGRTNCPRQRYINPARAIPLVNVNNSPRVVLTTCSIVIRLHILQKTDVLKAVAD